MPSARARLEAEIAGIRADRARLNACPLLETTAKTPRRRGPYRSRSSSGSPLPRTARPRSGARSRAGSALIGEVLAALQRIGHRPPPAVLVLRPEDIPRPSAPRAGCSVRSCPICARRSPHSRHRPRRAGPPARGRRSPASAAGDRRRDRATGRRTPAPRLPGQKPRARARGPAPPGTSRPSAVPAGAPAARG